jgi:hypothetical protein
MRELGPFDKKLPPRDSRPGKQWPKPDFVRATLTAQELHAYYIAVISSAWLCVAPDGLRLKAS